MVGNTFGAPIFVVLLLCFCGSSMLCGCNGDGGSVLYIFLCCAMVVASVLCSCSVVVVLCCVVQWWFYN